MIFFFHVEKDKLKSLKMKFNNIAQVPKQLVELAVVLVRLHEQTDHQLAARSTLDLHEFITNKGQRDEGAVHSI